jgi:predicted O-methyltransferase YrrM
LIVDIVLWDSYVPDPSGKVIETVTIRKFNKMVYAEERLLTLIIPPRDGMMVGLKVSER